MDGRRVNNVRCVWKSRSNWTDEARARETAEETHYNHSQSAHMEGSLSTVHVVGFHEVILTTVGWKLNVTQLSLSRHSGEVFRRWNITDFGFFFLVTSSSRCSWAERRRKKGRHLKRYKENEKSLAGLLVPHAADGGPTWARNSEVFML